MTNCLKTDFLFEYGVLITLKKGTCKDCVFLGKDGDGYCCLKEKHMSPDSKSCKKFKGMNFDEHSKSYPYKYAKEERQKEKEQNALIFRIVEVVLLLILVIVTIIFGLKSL